MGKDSRMAQLPTQSQFGDYSEWPGRDVLDSGGQRLGGVREIYLDRETGRPEWVLVDVEGSDARFVPLADATVEALSIRVAHTAEKIKAAPGIGAEPRIDQSEERRLYAHYGLGYSEDDSGSGLPAADEPPAPTGWGQKEEPSWQASGGEAPTESATDAEPSNVAPPPAEPPSPSELEKADIPEEPPAAGAYETAPFGAVSPRDEAPTDAVDAPPLFDEPAEPLSAVEEQSTGVASTPSGFAPAPDADEPAPDTPEAAADVPGVTGTGDGTFATAGPEDAPAGTFATTAAEADEATPAAPDAEPAPTAPALSPHAAPPEAADEALADSEPVEPPVGALDAPPADVPPAPVFTPPTAEDAPPPPVTADTPEAADSGPSSFAPPIAEEQGAAGGALERVKRDPKKVALAAVGAAVLFFFIRRLR